MTGEYFKNKKAKATKGFRFRLQLLWNYEREYSISRMLHDVKLCRQSRRD